MPYAPPKGDEASFELKLYTAPAGDEANFELGAEVQFIEPVGIASEEAFGTAELKIFLQVIAPSGIASAEAFGQPAVQISLLIIEPSGIPSAEAFGTPVIRSGEAIKPAGIPSEEAFGTAETTLMLQIIAPSGVASEEAFGEPGIVIRQFIAPSGIASEEAFGEPVIREITSVRPTGIDSEEAFGEPHIRLEAIPITPTGITSAEAFGALYIYRGNRVDSISIYPAAVSIEEGSMVAVRATIMPRDARDKSIIWTTSDYAVASVIGDGQDAIIRGNLEGSATITAATMDGGLTATTAVTVEEKVIPAYEALKILKPNFAEVATLDNIEIMDLTISKELSGHHGTEFTLPVGATGWDELKRGRYIKTENQKYYIETITPARGADGNPQISVSCTHIFFEIERDNMPHDTSARASILEHLSYVLRGTGIIVVGTDKNNLFYDIERVIGYERTETRLDGFQKVFQIFGGHYRLDEFTVEVVPPKPQPVTSAVALEYAVTNESIDKEEDDTDVITILHATAEGLKRTVKASAEIRALYRRDRVEFVDFGDIRVYNNFVYVTDQYLEKRQLPRTSYSLTVAELKRVAGIENLYPGRDFDIRVGKVVQVKDTEIGIEDNELIQRYSYKPLEKDSLSSVTVGDKPPDITFEEVSREGTVGGEEGEWRYDEETGEWIWFPDEPDHEDDEVGEDYTLAITEHDESCGPAEVKYRYTTGTNAYEKSTLTINSGAEATGGVTVILEARLYSTEVATGDTPAQVAEKIAGKNYPGWTVSRTENVIIFTATAYGAKKYSADYRFGLTGATGNFKTIKGRKEQETSDWQNESVPLEIDFAEGDVVEVIPQDSEYYSMVKWEGDGTDKDWPEREFTMTANRSATVWFATTGPSPKVETKSPSDVEADSIVLHGEVTRTGKFDALEVGFFWGFDDGINISHHEGEISAGSSDGEFEATVDRDTELPLDQKYYYRAFARAQDQECDREILRIGRVRSYTYAYEDWQVTITFMVTEMVELDEDEVVVTPHIGVDYIVDGAELVAEIDESTLPTGYEFAGWAVDEPPGPTKFSLSDLVADNPMTIDSVEKDYWIAAVITKKEMLLRIEQDGIGAGAVIIEQIGAGEAGEKHRLPHEGRYSNTVMATAVPDPETEFKEWIGDGSGPDTETTRQFYFDGEEEGLEYLATVKWGVEACRTRCIFISPEDPDPAIGANGDVWLKYQEGE